MIALDALVATCLGQGWITKQSGGSGCGLLCLADNLVSDYTRLGAGEKVVSWRYGWFEQWFTC